MHTQSLEGTSAPFLIPIRQMDGSLSIVRMKDLVWPELELYLSNNRPKALLSFLPPEKHLGTIIFQAATTVGIPLVYGSVYNLPLTVQAYLGSGATCILSEVNVLPYLLKALERHQEATMPLYIILVSEKDVEVISFNPPFNSKVIHVLNPFSYHVSK